MVGKYRITEVKVTDGYELSKEATEVEITKEQKEINITATNKLKLELPAAGAINYIVVISAIGISIMIIAVSVKLIGKKV